MSFAFGFILGLVSVTMPFAYGSWHARNESRKINEAINEHIPNIYISRDKK